MIFYDIDNLQYYCKPSTGTKHTEIFSDKDECKQNPTPCGVGGQCTNKPGTYDCVCSAGYEYTTTPYKTCLSKSLYEYTTTPYKTCLSKSHFCWQKCIWLQEHQGDH